MTRLCPQREAPLPFLPPGDDGIGPSGEWPLQTFLELGALPTAVPCARLHARQVLWEWGLSALSETIELVFSELVTNAMQTSDGLLGDRYDGRRTPGLPPVRLW